MVEQEFSKFGAIKSGGIQVKCQPDQFCFGFVKFESQQSMLAAIEVKCRCIMRCAPMWSTMCQYHLIGSFSVIKIGLGLALEYSSSFWESFSSFDKGLIAMGNILFLSGLGLTIWSEINYAILHQAKELQGFCIHCIC
ncbi:unnamed protein product [Miscanthus lutarioriparius]|uniref:RRM domain-containing protein n=1 Tax=Miscanthus lutarioriparius TaxID=422564 RepID=A0A811Q116_9POAL|nr:unnamed protein product [Miscanthus lutarioriparius]